MITNLSVKVTNFIKCAETSIALPDVGGGHTDLEILPVFVGFIYRVSQIYNNPMILNVCS